MGKPSAKAEVNEYRMSLHYGVCLGPVRFKKIATDEDKVIWEGNIGDAQYVDIYKPDLFGGVKKEGGVAGRIWFLPGKPDQVMPEELARRFGLTSATCPAFRGVATLFFIGNGQTSGYTGQPMRQGVPAIMGINPVFIPSSMDAGFYWAANSPFVRPIKVTVESACDSLPAPDGMIGNDVNPAHLIYECMVDQEWGMGAASYAIDTPAFVKLAATMKTENLGLSMIWARQSTVEDYINEIIDHVQATVFVDPRTGLLTIRALRDDYELATIRNINPSNARMARYSRKLWGETTNEIVGTWTNPVNEQEETVTAHDLGNMAAQGQPISSSRNYYGARSSELCMRLIQRDLRAAAAPLATCEVEMDRSAWDALPGEVVRVTWPKYKLNGLIMRVLKVGYGKKRAGTVKLTLMEDIFSLSKPAAIPPPATAWNGQSVAPAPMDFSHVFTLPLYMLQRQVNLQDTTISYPDAAMGVLGYRNSNDVVGFDLYTEQVSGAGAALWESAGTKAAVGRVTTGTIFPQEAVTAVTGLPLIAQSRGPSVGGLVFIGAGSDHFVEIALLRAFDPATNTWTIDRGVLDTVPREWPVGTATWFVPLEANIVDDIQFFAAGSVPEYKLLTRTSQGTLDLETAPVVTGNTTPRPHAPLRPANVKINGVGFGEVNATAATDLVVTWATRNRLLEDNPIARWTDSPITPEYLQMTIVTVFRENGAVMISYRGLYTEQTLTIPIAHVQEEESIFIRVSSEREGIASLQSYGLWVRNIPQIASPAAPPTPTEPPPPPPPDPEEPPVAPPPAGTEDPPTGGGGGGTGYWENSSI